MGWYVAQTQVKDGEEAKDRSIQVAGVSADGLQKNISISEDGRLEVQRDPEQVTFDQSLLCDILLELRVMNHHLSVLTESGITTDEI